MIEVRKRPGWHFFKKFVVDELPVKKGRVGIIGATPQDLSDLSAGDRLRQIFAADGKKAVCYGMGDGWMR